MTAIDYEALAKAAYEVRGHAHWDRTDERGVWQASARAVVAALRDQGFVVVNADDLAFVLDEFVPPDVIRDRMRAALAAPGDDDGAASRSLLRDTVSADEP